MQRPRIEFGTIQTFTGQPDCTVAIELPFIDIALPDWIKPVPDGLGFYIASPWRLLSTVALDELLAYMNKQSLLIDACRVAMFRGMVTLLKDELHTPIYARWVPGIPAD
jgi:hypothetical protein